MTAGTYTNLVESYLLFFRKSGILICISLLVAGLKGWLGAGEGSGRHSGCRLRNIPGSGYTWALCIPGRLRPDYSRGSNIPGMPVCWYKVQTLLLLPQALPHVPAVRRALLLPVPLS